MLPQTTVFSGLDSDDWEIPAPIIYRDPPVTHDYLAECAQRELGHAEGQLTGFLQGLCAGILATVICFAAVLLTR